MAHALDDCRTLYGARLHFHDDGSVAVSLWHEPRGRGRRPVYLVGPLEVFTTSPEHDALSQALYALDRAFRSPWARLQAARDAGASRTTGQPRTPRA